MKSVVALSSTGGVDYAALEEGCQAVYLAGNKHFDFTAKSEHDSKTSEDEKLKEEGKESAYVFVCHSRNLLLRD